MEALLLDLEEIEASEEAQSPGPLPCILVASGSSSTESIRMHDTTPMSDIASKLFQICGNDILLEALTGPAYPPMDDHVLDEKNLWDPPITSSAEFDLPALSRTIPCSIFSVPMSGPSSTLFLKPATLEEAVFGKPCTWKMVEEQLADAEESVERSIMASRDKLMSYSKAQWSSSNRIGAGGMESETAKPLSAFSEETVRASLSIFEIKNIEELSLFTVPPNVFIDNGLSLASVRGKVPDLRLEHVPMEEAVQEPVHSAAHDEGSAQPKAGAEFDPPTSAVFGALRFDELIADEDSLQFELFMGEDETNNAAATSEEKHDDTFSNENVAGEENEDDRWLVSDVQTKDEFVKGSVNSQSRLDQLASSKVKGEWALTDKLDNSEFDAIRPRLAMQYPFELDEFQKQAVMRLERKECVFVAAHTSAGKTVVAEYAIALAKRHMTRTIYTSPIKALSNQKYRDFKERFEDVGIITGDVSVDPDASCLIMTTEILRSMLYRGADLIKDIEWVIFDEVHYVNDAERGVVWEEVIIMLPDHANMVFLSATTPNTFEFSDWIGRTKRKPVYVISTSHRPVPLQHYLYSDNDLFKVMDHKGAFLSNSYSAAVRKRRDKEEKPEKGKQSSQAQKQGAKASSQSKGTKTVSKTTNAPRREVAGSRNQWLGLINTLQKSTLLPVVVFSFSKKKCEECADCLQSLDLMDNREKSAVVKLMSEVTRRLSESDSRLRQVTRVYDLLIRGVGVHHGGILPILKEMVEILFSKGVVKVLFATETFAMGVNMPARTVVFNGLRKHDGKEFRDLLPGEYTQMAGRAGRRGLDKVGTVILTCWNDILPEVNLKAILKGKPTILQSQFRLTYNMILNLLRVQDLSVEDMIKRSFSEFHTQRALGARNIPQLLAKLDERLKRVQQESEDDECVRGEPAIEEFYRNTLNCRGMNKAQLDFIVSTSKSSSSMLGPGRILLVVKDDMPPSPALVLIGPTDAAPSSVTIGKPTSTLELKYETGDPVPTNKSAWTLSVLVLCPIEFEPNLSPNSNSTPAPDRDDNYNSASGVAFGKLTMITRDDTTTRSTLISRLQIGATGASAGRKWWYTSITGENVVMVTSKKKKCDMELLMDANRNTSEMAAVVQSLVECEGNPDVISVDAVRDMKVNNLEFAGAFADLLHVQAQALTSKCVGCPKLTHQYSVTHTKEKLRATIAQLRHHLSNESLSLFPDFQQRLSVLHRLGYAYPNEADGGRGGTVALKGRVACEINTCEELIATEIIFENVLEPLNPPEAVGVLSALVFQEKGHDAEPLTSRMEIAKERMHDIAMGLGKLQFEAGLPTNGPDYCKHLNFGLAHVVYLWATKAPFQRIAELTLAQEGSIVRCITRLDELCRDVRNAARVIGNPSLYRKMEDASISIRRDIVFAASLYIK